jgi:hypothetical protein
MLLEQKLLEEMSENMLLEQMLGEEQLEQFCTYLQGNVYSIKVPPRFHEQKNQYK